MRNWDGAVHASRLLPGLIRSGTLSSLSEQGRQELLGGVSRIIDLWNRAERQLAPALFEGHPASLNLPLLPQQHAVVNDARAAGQTNADFYRADLDHGHCAGAGAVRRAQG